MSNLRDYYERAIREFGSSDEGNQDFYITFSLLGDNTFFIPVYQYISLIAINFIDLWMNYIKEELNGHGNPEKCGNLHWRAIKILEGESADRFSTRYTLMQTGHI